MLRPGRKHKFRIAYTPVKYEGDVLLERTIIFNGIAFTVGLPIQTEFTWNTWRFGYEYDFVYTDRGFVGFIVEARYVDAQLALQSPIDNEFTQAKGPVPAIGGIGRVYVHKRVSITGEVTGMKVPEVQNYVGSFFDLDIYGTVNFTHNFGAQAGFRTLTPRIRQRTTRATSRWMGCTSQESCASRSGRAGRPTPSAWFDPRAQQARVAAGRIQTSAGRNAAGGRDGEGAGAVGGLARDVEVPDLARRQFAAHRLHSPARTVDRTARAALPDAQRHRRRAAGDQRDLSPARGPQASAFGPGPPTDDKEHARRSRDGALGAQAARRRVARLHQGHRQMFGGTRQGRIARQPERGGAGGQIDLAAGRARRLLHQRAGRHHLIGPAQRDGDGARRR